MTPREVRWLLALIGYDVWNDVRHLRLPSGRRPPTLRYLALTNVALLPKFQLDFGRGRIILSHRVTLLGLWRAVSDAMDSPDLISEAMPMRRICGNQYEFLWSVVNARLLVDAGSYAQGRDRVVMHRLLGAAK